MRELNCCLVMPYFSLAEQRKLLELTNSLASVIDNAVTSPEISTLLQIASQPRSSTSTAVQPCTSNTSTVCSSTTLNHVPATSSSYPASLVTSPTSSVLSAEALAAAASLNQPGVRIDLSYNAFYKVE